MATDGRIDSEGCPDGMVLSDGFNDGSPLGSIEVEGAAKETHKEI